jgi:hypothetical protein
MVALLHEALVLPLSERVSFHDLFVVVWPVWLL